MTTNDHLQFDLYTVNARRTDPISSAMADADQHASGRRDRNLDIVLRLLAAHPNHTSRELSVLSGLDRHEVARRTADLKRKGLAEHTAKPRPDRSGGRAAVAWSLTEKGSEVLTKL